MSAKLLKIDGTATDITPANGKSFTLQECYKAIGCEMIQVVRLKKNQILIVDEEGLLKGNPIVNTEATRLAREAGTAEGIVGNAIMCPSKMLK